MRKTYQASKRYHKIGIILVLFLCAWQSLSAAIVLETPQTEVKVFVIDRIEERNETPYSSLSFPLCMVIINAKHPSVGYLHISHTPLINEFEQFDYQLFCEDLGILLPDVISYRCSPFLPLTITLTKLSVKLAMPLSKERSSYTSEISLHLKLEA